jgi:hypothetical protein
MEFAAIKTKSVWVLGVQDESLIAIAFYPLAKPMALRRGV